MKVSGFSFIKDAIRYDYPIGEALRSVLPLCDEVVVAVGKSSDATLDLVQAIDPKIRILETVWDESLRAGGQVLALETDKAYQAIAADSDWCFYIQGDEVLHEKDLELVRHAMMQYKDDERVEGLLFNYLHFYGSYDYLATASNFYRHEIRVLRRQAGIFSYRDAQGFRQGANQKLRVKPIDASIYHYGWVKPPRIMQAKQENFNRYWHDDAWVAKHIAPADEFDYSDMQSLQLFTGSHPQVMADRIRQKNWSFDYDISFERSSRKDKLKQWLFRNFGIDMNYRNYILLPD